MLCLTVLQERKRGQSHVSCETSGGSQERGVDYDFIAFHRQKENPFPSIPWWPLWRLWARGQTGCWWTFCWTCSWVHRLRIGCSRGITVNVVSSGANYPPLTLKSKVLRTKEHTHVSPTCSSAARHAEDRLAFQLFLTIWMRNVHGHLVSL